MSHGSSVVRTAGRGMLSVEEAREQMLARVEPLAVETVPVGESLGRVLAEPIDAKVTLPPWDNSSMDGFAVRTEDVAAATADDPIRLQVIGESAAGHAPEQTVGPMTAIRILTGAMLPAGATAVVPIEATDADPGASKLPEAVAIREPAAEGAWIRRAGSDLRAGRRLLEAGRLVRPAEIALIAASGHGSVSVHRRPRVAVMSTGDELVAAGTPLGPAQIPDSNAPMLAAQAAALGAKTRVISGVADRQEAVVAALREVTAWADLVIASGGVSVGAHDLVKEAFEEIGEIDLWRIAVQPGKPVAFGWTRGDGPSSSTLLFGLPGNPVSSFVTFELFVRPVLLQMSGRADPTRRTTIRARLGEPVKKAPGRRAYLRVTLERAAGGEPASAGEQEWVARLAGGQDSHVLSALAAADGLAIIPEHQDRLPAGAEVEVVVLDDGSIR